MEDHQQERRIGDKERERRSAIWNKSQEMSGGKPETESERMTYIESLVSMDHANLGISSVFSSNQHPQIVIKYF